MTGDGPLTTKRGIEVLEVLTAVLTTHSELCCDKSELISKGVGTSELGDKISKFITLASVVFVHISLDDNSDPISKGEGISGLEDVISEFKMLVSVVLVHISLEVTDSGSAV